ncbi:aldehyde dehydrogenase family protein [Malacoplasma iowae]|nr:aldehyde dehydrogenase family protein [Malacoplasma iowae]
MGTKSFILRKPKGNVLIISPFNYPFNLAFIPMVGALATNNKICLKSSPNTPNINKVISEIIKVTFDEQTVRYIDDKDINSYDDLYKMGFDLVFFTGSTKVGMIVAKKCVENNIEFITELGGKCPCVVNDVINDSIYERITWAKFMNAGQTCVSINHIFYKSTITDFIDKLKLEINKQYPNCLQNKNIPKIINQKEYDRLKDILNKYKNNIVFGGNFDDQNMLIEPTIIKVDSINPMIETEEIFGPIIFVYAYDEKFEQIINYINKIDNSPLAAYIYTGHESLANKFVSVINAGGYCINDSISHILNHNLPFGGVKTSGFGRYHGKYSFEAFTYEKPVMINNAKKNNKIKFFNNEIDYNKTKKLIAFVKKYKD